MLVEGTIEPRRRTWGDEGRAMEWERGGVRGRPSERPLWHGGGGSERRLCGKVFEFWDAGDEGEVGGGIGCGKGRGGGESVAG